jgi:hypothetical protein
VFRGTAGLELCVKELCWTDIWTGLQCVSKTDAEVKSDIRIQISTSIILSNMVIYCCNTAKVCATS